MAPSLAIITVVYNNYSILPEFLESLAKQTNKNFHLFIVDASPKRQVIDSKTVPFTLTECTNLGYAYGVNIGINEAMKKGWDKFCVINDDVYFESNFVENILNCFELYKSSLFGGKIYYAPGYEYHKKYKTEELGKVLWYAGGTVDWDHALTHHRGVDEVDHGQYDTPEDTEFITGCCMCFDKKIVETIGLWDTNYFMYYEDADYCEKAKLNNISLHYDPKIVLWHKNAQSTDGAGSALHMKYQESSRFKYAIKYAPWKTKLHIIWNFMRKKQA